MPTSPEFIPPLTPHPEVFSTDLRGADLNELFLRLVSRQIDDVSIDGIKMVAITEVNQYDHRNTVQVVTTDEGGRAHVFVYGSGEDDLIEHFLLPQE